MGLFGGVLFFFIVEDFSLSFKSLALEVIEIPDVSDIAHDVCSSPVVNGGGGGISGTFRDTTWLNETPNNQQSDAFIVYETIDYETDYDK